MDGHQSEYPRILYHYTSLETLALILENHTVRLMPLTGVDDCQESMTADCTNIASFVYVSCWTNDGKESVPMWNMYASLEAGVRIALPSFPFETYPLTDESIRKATGSLPQEPHPITANIRSVIPPEDLYNGFYYAPSDHGTNDILHQIIYTDDQEKLLPQTISIDEERADLWLTQIGLYKNTYWKFQKEWRYILWTLPINPLNKKVSLFDQMRQRIDGLQHGALSQRFSHYDLTIRADALEQIKVRLSPKMSVDNRVLAERLLESHDLSDALEESPLKGLL